MLVFYSGYGSWIVRGDDGRFFHETEVKRYAAVFGLPEIAIKEIQYKGHAKVSRLLYCSHEDSAGCQFDIDSVEKMAIENMGQYYFQPKIYSYDVLGYLDWSIAINRDDIIDLGAVPGAIREDDQESTDHIIENKLVRPSKVDAWCEAIFDMIDEYISLNGVMPSHHQAWSMLWTKPPAGYEITTGKHRGDDAMLMPGDTPLTKQALKERLDRYAKPSNKG